MADFTTSERYNFQNTKVDDLLREAFERCGMSAEVVSVIQAKSAISSLNFMLSDWVNRGLNLFAVDFQAIQIVPNQNTYNLPVGTVDILEATVAITDQKLDGTPYSSAGGNANNAFDNNPLTACTQITPDGYISYDYGTLAWPIQYIGVWANGNYTYSLAVEYSFDNTTWYSAIESVMPQYFSTVTPIWFVAENPITAQYWRIRETGGGTLDIREIYFNVHNTSRLLSRISRADYMSIPNKYGTLGIASSFLVLRTTSPTVILWPSPNLSYPLFVYSRARYIQDVNELFQNADTPQRFMEALVAGLSARLALKYFPDKYQLLNAEAEKAYSIAAQEDTERVPLTLTVDRTYGISCFD